MIACSSRHDALLTVNFHRKVLGQTGTGHYSPVGGFNARRDMVLILDVAKFKYDSYWCSLPVLYEALKPHDVVSKLSRGFLINRQKMSCLQCKSEESVTEKNTLIIKKLLDIRNNKDLSELKKLTAIFNDVSLHLLLVPLLYDYSTC